MQVYRLLYWLLLWISFSLLQCQKCYESFKIIVSVFDYRLRKTTNSNTRSIYSRIKIYCFRTFAIIKLAIEIFERISLATERVISFLSSSKGKKSHKKLIKSVFNMASNKWTNVVVPFALKLFSNMFKNIPFVVRQNIFRYLLYQDSYFCRSDFSAFLLWIALWLS